MDFEQKLRNYSKLIINHGLNIQKGQVVSLVGEIAHRQLLLYLTEDAYKAGAKSVSVEFVDPQLARIRLTESAEEDLEFVPTYLPAKYRELVDEKGASLRLTGSEFPDILSDLDPKRVNKTRMARYQALKFFYEEGIDKSLVHWNVAAASCPGWAERVFPELEKEEAVAALWDEIFKLCRCDEGDPLAHWKKHNEVLQSRAKKLSEMKVQELRFTGPGTDLTVGLHERAIFKGGGEMSARGVEFEPNLPTEECFSTPDYHKTNGTVAATRPFFINGTLISGLSMEFKDGVIQNFSADKGEETFKEYISSDEGAKRLGEVALVGIDSPVFKSGRVFEEILFDENAACHIAIGSAYKFCLEGGNDLSKEQLTEVGCNESSVHTDIMISNEHVDVVAKTYGGEEVTLIKAGEWIGEFAPS